MDINKKLYAYLARCLERNIRDFKKLESPHPLLLEAMTLLEKTNRTAIKEKYLQELVHNCTSHWTNPNEGYNPKEKIKALYFEYPYPCSKELEALAHGIVGKGTSIAYLNYYIKYDYQFSTSIEANYGICLQLSNILTVLEIDSEAFKEENFSDKNGYFDVLDACISADYLIFYEAIAEFVKTEAFLSLNRESVFHFLIGLHDAPSQPIYYYYEAEEYLINELETQENALEEPEVSFWADSEEEEIYSAKEKEVDAELDLWLNMLGLPQPQKYNVDMISCPKCQWKPTGHRLWLCTCGHSWDTFDTKGKCPNCHAQWQDTWCPRCERVSPHKEWYKTI